MTPEAFLAAATSNLQADGNAVTTVDFASGRAVVGYQGEFRWRWMATKLNLFTVVTVASQATSDGVTRLIAESIEHAKREKGRLRGFQTGVAVIPVLASATVSPSAIELVERRPVKGFAAFTMPAVVDLSSGAAHFYTGRVVFGAIYTKWLRERMGRVLPVPS